MRSTRYPNGVQAVRIEAYVHPDTAEALRYRSNGLPIGVLIDRLLGVVPDPLRGMSLPPVPQLDSSSAIRRAIAAKPTREHVWRHSATRGNFCEACKGLKSKVEGTNCVPIDENPAEEAHLTQKGPK